MAQKFLICLGSNTQQERHMTSAQRLLAETLGGIRFTKTIWTEPVGFQSPLYLNCLGYGKTALSYDELHQLTKDIELQLGRTKDDKLNHVVKIDIDILQLGDDLYHLSDWERAYLQELLHEILP